MQNTFWTLIDNDYYRIHNKTLKHAPQNQNTNKIETSQETKVEVISPERLEKINEKLGCSFMIGNFWRL